MIHIDGFHLSHIIESINVIEKERINKFLPKFSHPYSLNPDKPVSLGGFGPPYIYTEAKKSQDTALRESRHKISQVWNEFGEITDRYYSPIENYITEDSDVLLVTMGSFSENAMIAIDEMREKGEKIGLVRIRLWRPFPFDEFRDSVKNAKLLIVMDRAISFGGPVGPVCSEIQSALYPFDTKPQVVSLVGGLGGRDVDALTFENLIRRGIKMAKGDYKGDLEMIEVRQ
jgi:pyruvate ferredoxin oxidoreductase alpha subunit